MGEVVGSDQYVDPKVAVITRNVVVTVLVNTTVIEPTSQTGPGNFPVIGPGWCSPESVRFMDNSGARFLT